MARSSHYAPNPYVVQTPLTAPGTPIAVRRGTASCPPPPPKTTDEVEPENFPQQQGWWKLYLVLFVLLCVLVLVIKVQVVDPWWQGVQNQLHYGDSKINSQVLSLTGDTTVSNIVAFVRVDKQTGVAYIIVLDVQPGKAPQEFVKQVVDHASNQTVLTITAYDYNGDGKTDVVIGVQNTSITFGLLNDGKGTLSWAS